MRWSAVVGFMVLLPGCAEPAADDPPAEMEFWRPVASGAYGSRVMPDDAVVAIFNQSGSVSAFGFLPVRLAGTMTGEHRIVNAVAHADGLQSEVI